MAEGDSELLTNFKSWQAGELMLHHKLSVAWRGLTAYAPSEHHVFPCSTSNLPFLPVTTLDSRGRPWTSILAGNDGKPGFTTHSPCKTELEITAHLWEGDPLHGFSGDLGNENDGEAPVSGVGIELGVRKSYRKFAGTLVQLTKIGEGGVKLRLRVNQALRYVCGANADLRLNSLHDQALSEIPDFSRPRAPSEHGPQRPF
jgi:hypothetical protein